MGKLMYSPAEGDHSVTAVFGLSFNAGRPVEVDEEVFAKLKTNPQFKVASGEAAAKAEPAKVDGRSKAARAAKAEEEAKQRAAEHQADLAEAEDEAKAEKAKG